MIETKSIPTRYANTQFRSRLEARWAAFFDVAGWLWEYEPFDLDGWTPDFLLHCAGGNALVEVKPIDWCRPSIGCVFWMPDDGVDKVERYCRLSKDVHEGDIPREVLVVGAYLIPFRDDPGAGLGILASEGGGGVSGNAAVLEWGHESVLDFRSYNFSWHHRISGKHEGDQHLQPLAYTDARNLWREASNRVQWVRA